MSACARLRRSASFRRVASLSESRMASGKGSIAGPSRMAPSTGSTSWLYEWPLTNSAFDNLRFRAGPPMAFIWLIR